MESTENPLKNRVPKLNELFKLSKLLGHREKYTVIALGLICLIGLTGAIALASRAFSILTPMRGGTINEGVVGTVRFINPLLARSDVDKDLTMLVYSGLLRLGPDETMLPDLAERYELSPDGRVYTFHLRPNLLWQDGKELTSDDIVFTIKLAQSNAIKSPRQANWDGINISSPDPRTVIIILKQPYAPFLENTTLGILPKHIWQNVSVEDFPLSQFNLRAVGSGPYKISDIKTGTAGTVETLVLKSFDDFALGKAHIKNLIMRVYNDEQTLSSAFDKGEVTSASDISTQKAKALMVDGQRILTPKLTRLFAVFFNSNQANIFSDQKVRQALDLAIPREKIITQALDGFALAQSSILVTGEKMASTSDVTQAEKLLDASGWKKDKNGQRVKKDQVLEFTLATSDSPELVKTATIISQEWQKIGVKVNIKSYEVSDLNSSIIRPRKFDALLFGEQLGHIPDLYPFWHSSQRLDPGLNVAQYTNRRVDDIVEKLRVTIDNRLRQNLYIEFANEIDKDTPVIFLYSPFYLYAPNKLVKNITLNNLSSSEERFVNIYNWYILNERIWPIFVK